MNLFPETSISHWGDNRDVLISNAEDIIVTEAYIAKCAPKRYMAGEAATLNDVQLMLAHIQKSREITNASDYMFGIFDYIPKIGK